MAYNLLQIMGRKLFYLMEQKSITDMTILSIGVRPENELAEKAGLELGERGHIIVNEYLQTSKRCLCCR